MRLHKIKYAVLFFSLHLYKVFILDQFMACFMDILARLILCLYPETFLFTCP